MKRKLFILFFVLFFGHVMAVNKPVKLILCNPTYGNVQDFVYLIESKKIDIENLKIIGLYHKKEEENYLKSINFVKENKINWIKFDSISGDVPVEEMYIENIWTKKFKELFKNSDGIIFTGGPDIPPVYYGDKTSLLTVIVTPNRSNYELSLLFHLLGGNQNKQFEPLLKKRPLYMIMGICLGMQSINVATGGTLYQDIPSEIYKVFYHEDVLNLAKNNQHRNYLYYLTKDKNIDAGVFHEIILNKNSPIEFEKEKVHVLSIHHQCPKELGKDLIIFATSTDGKIVEGFKHEKFPHVLGVQFHPEKKRLWSASDSFLLNFKDKKTSADFFYSSSETVKFHENIWKLISYYLKKSYENK